MGLIVRLWDNWLKFVGTDTQGNPTFNGQPFVDTSNLVVKDGDKVLSEMNYSATDKAKVDNLPTNAIQELAGKQATLVNGQNIRPVNGQTLLGTDNLVIEGTANMMAVDFDFSPNVFAYPARPAVSKVYYTGPEGVTPADAEDNDIIAELPIVAPPVIGQVSKSGNHVTIPWTCAESAPTAFEIYRRVLGTTPWGSPIYTTPDGNTFQHVDTTAEYDTSYEYAVRTLKGSWERSAMDIEVVIIGSENTRDSLIDIAAPSYRFTLDDAPSAVAVYDKISQTSIGAWYGSGTMQQPPLVNDGGFSITTQGVAWGKRGVIPITQFQMNQSKVCVLFWIKDALTDGNDRAAFSFWDSADGNPDFKLSNYSPSAPYQGARIVYRGSDGTNKINTDTGFTWGGLTTPTACCLVIDGIAGTYAAYFNNMLSAQKSGSVAVAEADVFDRLTLMKDMDGTAPCFGATYDDFLVWIGDTLPTQQQLQDIVDAS